MLLYVVDFFLILKKLTQFSIYPLPIIIFSLLSLYFLHNFIAPDTSNYYLSEPVFNYSYYFITFSSIA